MSEDSTNASTDTPTTDTGPADEAAAVATADAPTQAVEPATPAKVSWYNRTTGGQTYLDRYVYPALVPLISVAVIIFYVVNVSRVFLSGKGTIAIVAAATITVAILVVASIVSSASRMRTQSLTVLTAITLLAVAFGGWIAVGHAQRKEAAVAPPCAPVGSTVSVIVPGAALAFNSKTFTAKAGCVKFVYGGTAGHTLAFDPPGPTGPILASGGSGGSNTYSWALTPGNYTIYCTLPGHRGAGMEATVTVK